MELRTCKDCNQDRPLDQFRMVGKSKRWREWRCRPCWKIFRRLYYDTHRNEHRTRMREWNLRVRYGISTDAYDALLEQQGGRCAICELKSALPLRVDHCHSSGSVRALLCHHCNSAIGLFREDVSLVSRAAGYLSHHNERLGVNLNENESTH